MLHTLRLHLLHTSFVKLDETWRYEHVISPFSRLYLITDGEGWVFHHGKKFLLKPHHLYLIPAFSYSQYHCDHYLEQYYIHFFDVMEGGLGVFDRLPLSYEVPAKPTDRGLMDRLLELYPDRPVHNPDPISYDNRSELYRFDHPEQVEAGQKLLEGQGLLLQLFSRFLERKPPHHPTKKQAGYHRLSSVVSHMQQHLAEPMTVASLAEKAHLNPDYFSRLFLEVMGMRPLDYLNSKRLERAQLLLTTTDAPLQEVAERCGIPNLSYFSRLFRRQFGQPPGAYRRQRWQV